MKDIDELQSFIENQLHADVDTKTYNEIMTDAETLDTDSFMKKWDDWMYENSEGWDTFRPQTKDLYTRMREAFGSDDAKNPFDVGEGKIRQIYESKFKDVQPEKFNETLANMSKYWEDEKRAREYNAGKVRREKEVKDWPWYKNMLASDYSILTLPAPPAWPIHLQIGQWTIHNFPVPQWCYTRVT